MEKNTDKNGSFVKVINWKNVTRAELLPSMDFDSDSGPEELFGVSKPYLNHLLKYIDVSKEISRALNLGEKRDLETSDNDIEGIKKPKYTD